MLGGIFARFPSGIFVDLGANHGLVTEKALERGYQVYAFDPDPDALVGLRKHVGRDPNVEIIPKAVGASNRSA
jgi:FkbM family methyltransferase